MNPPNPLPDEIFSALSPLTPLQLAWLSGYCWAQAGGAADAPQRPSENTDPAVQAAAAPANITVLSASQTGNARAVAARLHEALLSRNLPATLVSCADYKPKHLAAEQILLLVTSTQGEGEPPEEALSLFKLVNGKKAPDLGGLKFAVLGLGDSSYPKFCGAAVDFDSRLAALGGVRLLPTHGLRFGISGRGRGVDGENRPRRCRRMQSRPRRAGRAAVFRRPQCRTKRVRQRKPVPRHLVRAPEKSPAAIPTKTCAISNSTLAGSGLQYTAGDALGVWFDNDGELVSRLLAAVSLTGDEAVDVNGENKTLRAALTHDYEISQNTPHFVKGYAELAGNAELAERAQADAAALVAEYPPVALAEHYPAQLTAKQLVSLLRLLTPRLYSIASAQDEVGDEVHLTVGVLNYESDGKPFTGAASGYLAERLPEEGQVRVFANATPISACPKSRHADYYDRLRHRHRPLPRFYAAASRRRCGRQKLAGVRQPAFHRRFSVSDRMAAVCQRRPVDQIQLRLVARPERKNLCAAPFAGKRRADLGLDERGRACVCVRRRGQNGQRRGSRAAGRHRGTRRHGRRRGRRISGRNAAGKTLPARCLLIDTP